MYAHASVAACLLAAAANSAHAALIELTVSGSFGTITQMHGSNNRLPLNGNDFLTLNSSFVHGSFSVVFQWSNSTGTCRNDLSLYDFHVSSTDPRGTTVTVRVTQDYATQSVASWNAFHSFNATASFSHAGQSASVSATSTHESTTLPDLSGTFNSSGPGTLPISLSSLPSTPITPFGGDYRIDTTYTFVLASGSAGSVSIDRTNNNAGFNRAVCQVPAPAFAGTLGAAAVVLAGPRRRPRAAQNR